jgi:hypothetical protein
MALLKDAPRGAPQLQLLQCRDVPDRDGKGLADVPGLRTRAGQGAGGAEKRAEVEHNRLDARLAREARFAKASSLSEEARLAKARSGGEAVLRGGVLGRGTTFVAALFR